MSNNLSPAAITAALKAAGAGAHAPHYPLHCQWPHHLCHCCRLTAQHLKLKKFWTSWIHCKMNRLLTKILKSNWTSVLIPVNRYLGSLHTPSETPRSKDHQHLPVPTNGWPLWSHNREWSSIFWSAPNLNSVDIPRRKPVSRVSIHVKHYQQVPPHRVPGRNRKT